MKASAVRVRGADRCRPGALFDVLAVAAESYGSGEDGEPLAKPTKAAASSAIAVGATATRKTVILRFARVAS